MMGNMKLEMEAYNKGKTYTIKIHPTDNVVVYPAGEKRLVRRKLKDHGDELVRIAELVRESLKDDDGKEAE